MSPRPPKDPLPIIGWREWIELPEFGVKSIKAKVDTGARTSSLHAYDVEVFGGKKKRVRFKIHPEQRDSDHEIVAEAPLVEWRNVRPSSGRQEQRPVVMTVIELLGQRHEVELTLTRRDSMGFRMLLGREAVRRRFVVDPGTSFLNGRRLKGSRAIKKPKPKPKAKAKPLVASKKKKKR